ncbi:MAG: hypothetical protein WDZ49_02420 [Litorilinea sp.]
MQNTSERRTRGWMALGVAILLALAHGGATPALAQGYRVVSYTIDGGGGRGQSSSYILRGVTGQPDAGLHLGGGYRLYGGFFAPLRAAVDPGAPSIFLPTLDRGP